MNTLVYPSESRTALRRVLEVHEPTAPKPGNTSTSPEAGAESDLNELDAVSLHSLVRDPHGAHLENFQFAFMMFGILLTGVTAVVWGILLTSAWLAAIGFSITLAGCALYGWSLYDE
jgi:hypothetical protein